MPLNVLICPDKFKGTLTAAAAAKSIALGWRRARPRDSLALLPMSDGGDGFGEVAGELLHGQIQSLQTMDAAHRSRRARWWWEPISKTAVIESADVIGLALLPPGKIHPFELDTFGLGAVIRAASARGAKRCFIGIGGSATNDGGFGLARSLGWLFFDRDNRSIERWTDLHKLVRLAAPRRRRWFTQLVVAVDVQNPLLGIAGATRVYGPQKGLNKRDFELSERCLARLASVLAKESPMAAPARSGRMKPRLQAVHGAGAAGGLGFGLLAFTGARLEPGFDLFARLAKLDRKLDWADLVITGEGAIDRSTLMGKGVGQLARQCRRFGIPCLSLAGTRGDWSQRPRIFAQVHALTDLTGTASAKSNPAYWLEQLAERVGSEWSDETRPRS